MSRQEQRSVHTSSKQRQFVDRAAKILESSPNDVREMFSRVQRPSIRVNPLVGDPVETSASINSLWDLEQLAWCPEGYALQGSRSPIVQSEFFSDGRIFLQNASSFLPVIALDSMRGQTIFDVSAAPGGKASHVAARLRNDCHLWLNDSSKLRLEKLREVLELLNVKPETFSQYPGQYLDKYVDSRFDRILLDAQCTGEGRVNLSNPHSLDHWSVSRIENYGRLQQRMLVAAFKLLDPGGVLVYSTCTLSPEENESPVNHLLRHFPASLCPIDVNLSNSRPGLASWSGTRYESEMERAVRIVPSESMEAFFVAKIVREV
jgi:tRNA (cytosine49-C5)-methyltransferase